MRLPRAKIVSILYSTQGMKLAVEHLYSYILEFLLIAYGWCNKYKFRHSYHSFTRPHALRYDDLLARITNCSNDVMQIASVGSQAELRVMHEDQTTRLQDVITMLSTADNHRKDQLDSLNNAIARLDSSSREQEKKFNLVITLLRDLGLTSDELLTKIESKYFHDGQIQVGFMLIIK